MPERRFHTVREIMETFAPRRAAADREAVDKLVRDFRERLGVTQEAPPSSAHDDQRAQRTAASKP